MQRRFRLEAKLRVAEYVLEEKQVIIAAEQKKLQEDIAALDRQLAKLQYAIQSQREACNNAPETLGHWHYFITTEQVVLDVYKAKFRQQEKVVAQCRNEVVEAYKELKKMQLLKDKHIKEFEEEQNKQQQAFIDETSQVAFCRDRL